MTVKKLRNADFHNANKLNGQKTPAKYGIFSNGVQVGWVMKSRVWDAYNIDFSARLVSFSCATLSDLKQVLSRA